MKNPIKEIVNMNESENEKNVTRREFLKRVGFGLGSFVAISALEPIKAIAKPAGMDMPRLAYGPAKDSKMTYRTHRQSNDKVSLLGYGMMRLPQRGRQIDQDMVNEEVDYAIAHGLNYFDTAPVYGGGQSEIATGIALKRHPRESFYIATKMSNMSGNDINTAKRMYETSMKNLQVDYIDYYLLHSVGGGGMEAFNRRFVDNGLLDFLHEEVKAGRIRNLGFSYHGNVKVFDYLVDNAEKYGFTFCQIEMNYIDWRHAKKSDGDAEYLYEKCEKAGLQCTVMEPLLGGRLARLNDEYLDQLKAVRPNDTAARWAFRWVASHPNVLTTLSGMTTMEVLKENIETFSPLDPCTPSENKLMADIADQMSGVPVIGCTACAYCMPCPFGVDIPGNFAYYNEKVNSKLIPYTAANEKAAKKEFQKGYKKALKKSAWATQCAGCNACVSKCPQSILIPSQLSRIADLIQG